MSKTYDVAVIGGGASGIMAAIVAAEAGASVVLLEKNKRLGEKLRITGGGRCNITNAEENLRVLLKNYGKAEPFLYSAFSEFGVPETIDFFTESKLPIKIEARNRAFPVSEKAADVVHALVNRLHRSGAVIMLQSPVTNIVRKEGKMQSIETNGIAITAKSYILATGGTSKPETGSTGDGFSWLETIGHTVKSPTPNITPLATIETWVSAVSGVTAKDVNITFYGNNVSQFKLRGDVLFTHFGISGPLILNNAYKVADLLNSEAVTATIDLFPTIELKTLDQRVATLMNENGTKMLKNFLPLCCPPGIAPAILAQLQGAVPLETKCSEVTKETRKLLVALLKNMHLTISHLMGFEKAVVADGGVHLKEINMRTFQSLLLPNVFVTGDLLDIRRPSGGFSLQLCWTSGYIAGKNAAKIASLLE